MENWETIDEFPNYAVSDQGRITNLSTGRILKTSLNRDGYAMVNLYNESGPSKRQVHRLVASAFFGTSDLDVDHGDGNRSRNSVDNLEYKSDRDNSLHSFTLGRSRDDRWFPKSVRCIETQEIFVSIGEASQKTGANPGSISRVVRGIEKSAKGLTFERVESGVI